MLSPEAVRLRIALALVLLEHQPAGLALHDYLKALRDEVKKRRSGGEVEDESVTSDDAEGSVEEEPEQREEPEPVVEADGAERIEQVEEPEEVERVEVEEPVPELPPNERLRLAASSLGDAVEQAVERLLHQLTSDPSVPSQSTPHAPSPSSSPVSGHLGAVLNALEGVAQREEEESAEGEAGLGWEELGTVVEWIMSQVASLPEEKKRNTEAEVKETGRMKTRGKKRKGKGSAEDEVKERTKEQLIDQLTHLLLRLATPAFDSPLALSVFAALLIRVTSFFPLVTLARFLPFLLDQLASLLPPLLRTSEVDDSSLQRLAALVSLLHLAFDALPPAQSLQFFLLDCASDALRPLRLSLERLTHLLTSTSTSLDPDNLSLRFLPAAGDGVAVVTVEAAVLGVLERCWEFSELDEREEQVEVAVRS
ncbi:hypothetical protein JCM10049v2_006947 [Rhodotorula toruloides]